MEIINRIYREKIIDKKFLNCIERDIEFNHAFFA